MTTQSKSIRILIISQFFDPEPAIIPGLPLAKWLANRGHDVQVLTGIPNYPGGKFYGGHKLRILSKQTMDEIKVSRAILYPSHDRSGSRRAFSYLSFGVSASLLGWIAIRPFDVIYVYHPPATTALPAILWKRMTRRPFVFHLQDIWPESVVQSGMIGNERVLNLARKALELWCNFVYREADSVAVIAPGMKRILEERGVPSAKIQVIRNWTAEHLFYPLPPDESLSREFNFDQHFSVVFAGNLGKFQGLETAILAANKVKHLAHFRLVLFGVGQEESNLKELAADLGAGNVEFFGRVPYKEMGPLTNLADALLVTLQDFPFLAATIPGKTQVALASGRPVIMSVAGDAADLITEARAGIVCTPGDVDSLASAFERLATMPAKERDAMGKRGRDFYLRELSLEAGASRIEQLLVEAALRSRD